MTAEELGDFRERVSPLWLDVDWDERKLNLRKFYANLNL